MKYLVVIFCLALFSCNSDSHRHQSNGLPEQIETTKSSNITGCYESIFGKDSTQLNLQFHEADSVVGKLSIHYYEKDKSDGMFTGIIQDDKILGWYNFNSEGKNSVRQMIFRIAGDSLIEGYGSIETNHDTAFFKDIPALNYLNQRPLIKVACD